MYYETIKNDTSKEWILFIHGLGGSINTWKKQLSKFSEKFNLLLIDLDGHGKSEFIKQKLRYKSQDACKQIKKILDKEKIKKINLMSMSLGTLVALEFIRMYPKRVKSNILAGCAINLDKKRKFLLSIVQGIKKYLPKNFLYRVFALILLPKKNHKLSREIFIRESLKMKKQAFLDWISNLDLSNSRLNKYILAINKNKIPTLFVMGNQDVMFIKGIKDLKDKIDDFKLQVINNCGHVCSIEKADIFNEISVNFYEQYA